MPAVPAAVQALALLAAFTLPLAAQTPSPAKTRTPIFLDPTRLDLTLILPAAPAPASPQTQAELAELHRIEQARTPAEIAAARFDEAHEDIFLFNTVLGPAFNAEALPLTSALSQHLRNDAALINGPLKKAFARPRPYNLDPSLHPPCETNRDNAYPSGHALNGYLYAFALAEIVPERHAEILARADNYAHQRLVCEAHFPSDLEASHRAAYALIGSMLANPRFQSELAAARAETRAALHLSPLLN